MLNSGFYKLLAFLRNENRNFDVSHLEDVQTRLKGLSFDELTGLRKGAEELTGEITKALVIVAMSP